MFYALEVQDPIVGLKPAIDTNKFMVLNKIVQSTVSEAKSQVIEVNTS